MKAKDYERVLANDWDHRNPTIYKKTLADTNIAIGLSCSLSAAVLEEKSENFA